VSVTGGVTEAGWSPTSYPSAAPIGPTRRLHVAVVDEELPYPPTSGKRIRTLSLILKLASRHRITYLAHRNANPTEARRAKEFLEGQGIETVVVDRAVPPKSGPGFYARLALNLASPLPYSVAVHTSRALRGVIAAYDAGHRVDLWQCEWTPYAESLRGLPGARTLVIAHNVESLIWRRYHESEVGRLRRWYVGHQWRKFEAFERRALAEAGGVVAVTEDDARLIRGQFGAARVDVVDNGVDTSAIVPSAVSGDPRKILFLGSLDWRPNQDAIGLLLDRIFPTVRAEEPSARLVIVGRRPPEALSRRVRAADGVELHADVADVRPFLHGCGVMAVPLRVGGGSRLKILEALAAGLPVVSTRVGAEGLHLKAGRDLEVVKGVDGMARAIVGCLRDPDRARAMADRGRRVVLVRYDWDNLADALERAWLRCVAG
jgi:glycosyltransferase involved in cell wall biosynthesis